MSIITSVLPDYVTVRGKKYQIRTDFKVWLEFSEILTKNISWAEKVIKMLNLTFPELPSNLAEALSTVMDFYSHSADSEKKDENSLKKACFDFEYDADLIYSAFYQQYNIDLTEASMHWWKFKALLSSLSEDTHFIKVVQYRSIDISKIKDKEQKKFYNSMKKRYKLPDKRSEEEKELCLNNAIETLF